MLRANESLVGRTIAGKFAIEAHLGSGAMGQVYRARQVALEKTVAVKVLHQDLARDQTFAARFHREAKAASRLDHPNSMRVIDFGAEPDGMLYIAMEYLDGRHLLQVLVEDGPLPETRVVDILTQALAALVVAHDMGVIHRDLKPENIMILAAESDEGHSVDVVKVCDFGIAKISGRGHEGGPESTRGPITTEGIVVGTPEYMSPEQGRGDALDARSDLYSVGVILFQLLVGRLPFEAETALGIVFKQVNESPPAPSSLRPGIEPRLEAVCLRALAKAPGERFQSAREMRAALRGALAGDALRISGSPTSMPRMPSSQPSLEHAETLTMPVSGGAYDRSSAHSMRPTLTAGGTAGLPAIPVSSPNAWMLGGVALVVGAALTAAVVAPWRATSVASNAVEGTTTLDAETHVALDASSVAPAIFDPIARNEPSSRPADKARNAGRPGVVATITSAPRPGAGAGAVAAREGFSLETSTASPTVTSAGGVDAKDVRAALPSWKFTQCYRDAMQHANAGLKGHVKLNLTLDATGVVTRATALGTADLLNATGGCMMDAVGNLHVKKATSTTGASAEVDVACSPR